MSTASDPSPISVQDYLAGELNARRKHEYVEGVVYAMAGGSNRHNLIASNATGALYSQLRGKRCRVFNSDTKIRVHLSAGIRFYYSDAMVVCEMNAGKESYQDSPVVIVEVLSESTRRTDENEKRDAYLSISSLLVYIRVEQALTSAIVDRRTSGVFVREAYQGMNATIPLPEIDCELRLDELYDNVEFESISAEEDESVSG